MKITKKHLKMPKWPKYGNFQLKNPNFVVLNLFFSLCIGTPATNHIGETRMHIFKGKHLTSTAFETCPFSGAIMYLYSVPCFPTRIGEIWELTVCRVRTQARAVTAPRTSRIFDEEGFISLVVVVSFFELLLLSF